MFYEFPIYMQYELMSNRHIIDKNNIVVEHRILNNKKILIDDFIKEKVIINNDYKSDEKRIKKNIVINTKNGLPKVIKYSNPFFTGLTTNQINSIADEFKNSGITQIIVNTFSNDSEIAENRFQKILEYIKPEFRKLTIFNQKECGIKCNITELKAIY